MNLDPSRRICGGQRILAGWLWILTVGFLLVLARPANAQLPIEQFGEVVPRDVREMYDRGLDYLVATQRDEGDWLGGQSGPGTTGMAIMALIASGEDPNFGKYASAVKRGLRNLIRLQDPTTGIMGTSMYEHGFASLGLAEAYGAVDERQLWTQGGRGEDRSRQRTIGQALELAVRGSLQSQKKNPYGAWRYSPESTDADTSVSGAVLVSLLAARNAGIEVPDEAIDRAIAYFKSMTSSSGQVGYSGGFGGFDESIARIAIAHLVYAVARRKDLAEHQSTLQYLVDNLERDTGSYLQYARYYQAQALFQGDLPAWERWNKKLVRELKKAQNDNGSFQGQFGLPVDTSLSLLALALNYRFLPIYER